MTTSHDSTLQHAIDLARTHQAPFALAICPDLTHHPHIAQHAKSIMGSRVHLIDVSGMSSSQARHAFINAVCRSSSIIAFGIGRDPEAASAIIDGLLSIGQWNKAACALGIAASIPSISHSSLANASFCHIPASPLLRNPPP
jgi:hypothetical protein